MDEDKVAVILDLSEERSHERGWLHTFAKEYKIVSGHGSLLPKLHPWMFTNREAAVQFDGWSKTSGKRHEQS